MKAFCLAAALCVFWATTGLLCGQEAVRIWPQDKTPYRLTIDEKTGSPLVRVYPTNETPSHTGAVAVVCPGGGYGGLAKDHEGHQIAQWFNDQGVTAFVLQYRLGSEGHHYPTQLADVQRAIRWVRAHASDYQIDPARLAVMGFSAGGHLASMAATLFDEKAYEGSDAIDEFSARPDFAILCYPVISFDPTITHGGSRKNLLGPERYQDETLARKLSSENNVTENTPRTFIFQTDADASVPAENATRFYLALRQKKVPAEFHVYQNGPHGVGLYRGDPILGTWSGLLKNWLRANSFLSANTSRTAISGEVTLDGQPVSWGVISFYPENPNLPITSIRIRNGKFSVKADEGPVKGRSTIRFEGSIWESTGALKDKVIQLDSLSPENRTAIVTEINTESKPIKLDFRSR